MRLHNKIKSRRLAAVRYSAKQQDFWKIIGQFDLDAHDPYFINRMNRITTSAML